MKRILFLLAFAPFMLNGQEVTPSNLTDLSKYHDDNRLLEKTDDNFAILKDTTDALRTSLSAVGDSSFVTLQADSANFTKAVIGVLDYDPPHGAMSFADSTATVPLTQNTWAKITNGDNDLFTVQDADDMTIAGDSMTISVAGDYIINWSISFNGTANDVFHIAIYKNAVIESITMTRKTSNTDTGNMGLPAYVENLIIGDDLSFYIRNTGDNDDAVLVSSSVLLHMLHPD